MRGHSGCVGLAAAILVASLAPGCGRSGEQAPLVFQTRARPGSAEYEVLETVVAAFNRGRRGMRVRLVGERLKLEYLLREIIARRSADLIEVGAAEVGFLARRGAVRRLPAPCRTLGAELDRHAWRLAHWEYELYGVPYAARPNLLLYNRAAFRRAGLPPDRPPRTWGEWLAAARRLTRDTDGDDRPDRYGFALAGRRSVDFGRHFATFLAQTGLPLIEFKGDYWAFNLARTGTRAAMEFLLGLARYAPPECVVTDDAGARKQFLSGRAAMVVAGPAGLQDGPGVRRRDIGAALLPAPAGRESRCRVDLAYVCVPAFVRGGRARAAVEFARFLAGRAAQEILARGADGRVAWVTVRRDVLRGEPYRGDPRLRAFARAVATAVPPLPAFAWEGKCAKDWIGEVHSLLIGDRRGVAYVLERAQERGDQALSCLFSDIGHPSTTMTLGMSFVAVLVFVAVAYAVSRR